MKNELILKNNLKKIRQEKGLTQSELAEQVGTTRQTIISIEKLEYIPSAKLAYLICLALDLSFEEMFFF